MPLHSGMQQIFLILLGKYEATAALSVSLMTISYALSDVGVHFLLSLCIPLGNNNHILSIL